MSGGTEKHHGVDHDRAADRSASQSAGHPQKRQRGRYQEHAAKGRGVLLPEEDRRYLRVDVTRRDIVERRTTELDSGRVDRLVAVADNAIVADGSLELEGHGWGDNIGEIRMMVARPFQHLGLGTLLARELYYLGMQHKLDRIVVRVMRPQSRAHRIMQRLGFKEEFLIPDHVRDQDGTWQDLIIMRCNLDKLWNEMESLVEASDWRWHR